MNEHDRDHFAAEELAVVLSHFNLGVIESITEFARGSRRSPKVGVVCERGKFLLKRRAPARAAPTRVSFAHQLQAFLVANAFPLPRLVPPVDGDETLLALGDHVYELFEFVGGQAYHGTPEETRAAGATLANLHELVRRFAPPPDCPRGDYHDALAVRTGLNSLPAATAGEGPLEHHLSTAAGGSGIPSTDAATATPEPGVKELIDALLTAYDQAGEMADQLGLSTWPEQVIHSDWHPGNLLFRGGQVVAVFDYDSARLARRALDVANGALQFSMIGGGHPDTWPDHLDEPRLEAFLAGYDQPNPLTEAELSSLPHLMIEALIGEAVMPIAATGSFGRWQGLSFMRMIQRKVAWLQTHAGRLVNDLRE